MQSRLLEHESQSSPEPPRLDRQPGSSSLQLEAVERLATALVGSVDSAAQPIMTRVMAKSAATAFMLFISTLLTAWSDIQPRRSQRSAESCRSDPPAALIGRIRRIRWPSVRRGLTGQQL